MKSIFNKNQTLLEKLDHSLSMGVLEADEPGGGVVEYTIGAPDSGDDPVDVHGVVGVVGDGPGVDASEGGDAVVLVDVVATSSKPCF
ncbi:hypothetical protein ZWY2020_008315 [Hordeum vulgare]|nr:hypothetical protein ZWY2020_008315 [Hordeum vulgare]